QTYGDAEVIAEMFRRLNPPRRLLARIWWKVRTSWTESRELMRRLRVLRQSMTGQKTGALFRRHRRRPSAQCQAKRPGIPHASSRTRRINARASDVSGGRPSK